MSSRTFREQVYREFMSFLETAEKTRRWDPFRDIDWAQLSTLPKSEKLALCAETFIGVESYLPDYINGHLELFRHGSQFARSYFAANWGYEEMKHAIVLREFLIRSGQRTLEQMFAYEDELYKNNWKRPFETERQMTCYGALQEMTTFLFYKKQERWAEAEGNPLLGSIYKTIARDEAAHTRFYEIIVKMHLDEDRQGTLQDLGHVWRNFRMPADDLVPNYADRVVVMREAGIDRGVFVNEVWKPLLKTLQLTRHDIPNRWSQPAGEAAAVQVVA